MLQDLSLCSKVAVDTESNSLYVYQEQVCLIQFSTGKTDYLVDPLVLKDISGLGSIFANPAIEKIFHAAEYDIICMKRDFGFTFTNLFDTMVAARVMGRDAIGLGPILEVEFGINIDKHFQRANWGLRPLPPAQLQYARLDSFYLIPLRERMQTALEASERWNLAREDFQRLCRTDVPVIDGCAAWTRVPGAQDLSPRQAAILDELCRYRDRQAQSANLPSFKILSNASLINIAALMPHSINELLMIGDLSPRQVSRHGEGLLQAVRVGTMAQPLKRTHNPRPDDRYLLRLDRLKNWRKKTGKEMGVESDVILPRDLMEQLSAAGPDNPQALAELMSEMPWRLARFGEEILYQLNHR
jgi:ribonuclease D